MVENTKIYEAIVWSNEPDAVGQRISVAAKNIYEAKQKLKAIYGEDKQIYVTDTEEASRPRGA